MQREYYLELANAGLTMPIVSDLVLHQYRDAGAILEDGVRLGMVLAESARRFHTPLAIPHMDLELEKQVLLEMLGVPGEQTAKFHFDTAPSPRVFDRLQQRLHDPLTLRLQAHIDSVGYIAHFTELLPVGMVIGPFSLMSKLVGDPITPVAMAGMGITAEDDPEVDCVEQVLELGFRMIMRSIALQIDAGARAIFIAEPAANKVYFSPNQLDAGSDIFDRFVMTYHRQIKAYLEDHNVDLFFHCCGELTDTMLGKFTELDPALLSLGSSRTLWEDAQLVPKNIVLYGNLPSKQFYSDALITAAQVELKGRELIAKMKEAGHPFILGTECDVLSVPGCEREIMSKVRAITRCRPAQTSALPAIGLS
ncbi:MAG TPA: uroporphyrinogen decarboxylase family protein [Armatimonadota bacterium]|jgi:uroporphyrinogen-III decarboxylase